MLIICKLPKSSMGPTKCPRGPHVTRGPRVWDSCGYNNRSDEFKISVWLGLSIMLSPQFPVAIIQSFA